VDGSAVPRPLENTVLENTANASPIPAEHSPSTWPIPDYEPPPVGVAPLCPSPTPAALRRHTPRPLRPVVAQAPPPSRERPEHRELSPPRAAATFADSALRGVLEVTDRRRPASQIRRLLAPTVYDAIMAQPPSSSSDGAAVLRRVRLRTAEAVDGEATAAEVFATYTRAARVRAIAGRIEVVRGGWLVVALQIG
jgi:Family of unknown function (DUF6459)